MTKIDGIDVSDDSGEEGYVTNAHTLYIEGPPVEADVQEPVMDKCPNCSVMVSRYTHGHCFNCFTHFDTATGTAFATQQEPKQMPIDDTRELQRPTAAQIAWLLQQGKLELEVEQSGGEMGWWIGLSQENDERGWVSDDLLEQVPADCPQPKPYAQAQAAVLKGYQRRVKELEAYNASLRNSYLPTRVADLEAERDELKRQLESQCAFGLEPMSNSIASTRVDLTMESMVEAAERIRDANFRWAGLPQSYFMKPEFKSAKVEPRGDATALAEVPDYHPGAVVHCQSQYDIDE
jgi:hypothetical protein